MHGSCIVYVGWPLLWCGESSVLFLMLFACVCALHVCTAYVPALASPPLLPFNVSVNVTVTGTLFTPFSLQCQLGSMYFPAIYVNSTTVLCEVQLTADGWYNLTVLSPSVVVTVSEQLSVQGANISTFLFLYTFAKYDVNNVQLSPDGCILSDQIMFSTHDTITL